MNNVISNEEYETLLRGLHSAGDKFWYFVVRFLACTGSRISELRCFEVRHVQAGYMDIISKGSKLRRIYVPASLQAETMEWLQGLDKSDGLLFCGAGEKALSSRGISLGLKRAAERFGINPDVVYPHSFRHLFAKNFIDRNPDIALLADLMGHDSIETTRIYLRRTEHEQKIEVDKTINW